MFRVLSHREESVRRKKVAIGSRNETVTRFIFKQKFKQNSARSLARMRLAMQRFSYAVGGGVFGRCRN